MPPVGLGYEYAVTRAQWYRAAAAAAAVTVTTVVCVCAVHARRLDTSLQHRLVQCMHAPLGCWPLSSGGTHEEQGERRIWAGGVM